MASVARPDSSGFAPQPSLQCKGKPADFGAIRAISKALVLRFADADAPGGRRMLPGFHRACVDQGMKRQSALFGALARQVAWTRAASGRVPLSNQASSDINAPR